MHLLCGYTTSDGKRWDLNGYFHCYAEAVAAAYMPLCLCQSSLTRLNLYDSTALHVVSSWAGRCINGIAREFHLDVTGIPFQLRAIYLSYLYSIYQRSLALQAVQIGIRAISQELKTSSVRSAGAGVQSTSRKGQEGPQSTMQMVSGSVDRKSFVHVESLMVFASASSSARPILKVAGVRRRQMWNVHRSPSQRALC